MCFLEGELWKGTKNSNVDNFESAFHSKCTQSTYYSCYIQSIANVIETSVFQKTKYGRSNILKSHENKSAKHTEKYYYHNNRQV